MTLSPRCSGSGPRATCGCWTLTSRRALTDKAGIGKAWTPRELRHSFVSMLSADGVATEDISHLVGHSSTRTTERVYRHELRPVLRTGAERMGRIFSQQS
jgi:integrase